MAQVRDPRRAGCPAHTSAPADPSGSRSATPTSPRVVRRSGRCCSVRCVRVRPEIDEEQLRHALPPRRQYSPGGRRAAHRPGAAPADRRRPRPLTASHPRAQRRSQAGTTPSRARSARAPTSQVIGTLLGAASLPPSGVLDHVPRRRSPRSARPGSFPRGSMFVVASTACRASSTGARTACRGCRRVAGRPLRAALGHRGLGLTVRMAVALDDVPQRFRPYGALGAPRSRHIEHGRGRAHRRAPRRGPRGAPRVRSAAVGQRGTFPGMASSPVHVTVTGAAGQIGYALVHRIAMAPCSAPTARGAPAARDRAGDADARRRRDGAQRRARPLLAGIEATSDLKTAFDGTSWALLVGSIPRKAGMERGDLLSVNGGIFKPQGQAVNDTRRATSACSSSATRATRTASSRARTRPTSRRPLVRDDPSRREPRQVAAWPSTPACPRRGHVHDDLGQPLGHAVPRLHAHAHRRHAPRPT